MKLNLKNKIKVNFKYIIERFKEKAHKVVNEKKILEIIKK